MIVYFICFYIYFSATRGDIVRIYIKNKHPLIDYQPQWLIYGNYSAYELRCVVTIYDPSCSLLILGFRNTSAQSASTALPALSCSG